MEIVVGPVGAVCVGVCSGDARDLLNYSSCDRVCLCHEGIYFSCDRVWHLPRVCPHVCSQVAGLSERPAARVADIRLLPRMCPPVLMQAAKLGERLAARLANM